VGWGGRPNGDGNSAQCAIVGNCRNTPVEVFETRYPWRTLSYRLRRDSGGPGKYRGGLGTDRVMEVIAPEITLSVLMDRMKVQPWGIFGGQGGNNAGVFIQRRGDDEFRTFQEVFGTVSPTKFANIRLQQGDKVLLRSAGGGGYGNPGQRSPEQVLADVRRGVISAEQAREAYGVVIAAGPNGWQIDEKATGVLRQTRSEATPVAKAVPALAKPLVLAGATTDRSGSWRTVTPSYLDNTMDHCDLCGKWLPQRAWIDDIHGTDQQFCNPICATLYEVYWLPRYGRQE
jgi:hypothetical protein